MTIDYQRDAYRKRFFIAWHKYKTNEIMEPVEQQLTRVILMHPEYQDMLAQSAERLQDELFTHAGEENPFLHMALHLSIIEQTSIDKPAGIKELYQTLVEQFGTVHDAEHAMMECLASFLWHAQQEGTNPNPDLYWEELQRLVKYAHS